VSTKVFFGMPSSADEQYRVLQIIPAPPGWFAVESYDASKIRRVPVAVWALVEVEETDYVPHQEIRAMIAFDGGGFLAVESTVEGSAADYRGIDYPGCDRDWQGELDAETRGEKPRGQ
jgi:hypothetical protein